MKDYKPNPISRSRDLKMLGALCAHELSDQEKEAFDDMYKKLQSKMSSLKDVKLTVAQRAWVTQAYEKYELDSGEAENLMSRGLVPRGKEVRFPYEDAPKPLKPPMRRIDPKELFRCDCKRYTSS